MNNLTNNRFWVKFWSDKQKPLLVTEKYYFSDILNDLSKKISNRTFVEIGGFPGNYSIYVKKYLDLSPTLIDLYIDDKQIEDRLRVNNLKNGDVKIVKGDIFKKKISNKYGIVFSSGFVEHFKDVVPVVKRHIEICDDHGYVIISVPNFLGLNGLLQKLFDNENLSIHNLKSMDIKYLDSIIKKLKVKNNSISYYGNFGLWLEKLESRNIFLKLIVYFSVFIRPLFRFFGINNKIFSPYVLIVINK